MRETLREGEVGRVRGGQGEGGWGETAGERRERRE